MTATFEQLASEGMNHASQGRYDQALRCFEAAAEVAPSSPEAAINLGSLHHEWAGVHQERGDVEAARHAIEQSRAHFARALELIGDSPDVPRGLLLVQARNLLVLGEVDGLSALLEPILRDVHSPPEARGQALELLGAVALAGVDVSDEDEAAFRDCWNRGQRLVREALMAGAQEELDEQTSSDLRAGIGTLRRAVTLIPQAWQAWWLLGSAQQLLEQHELALTSFEKGYELHPHHAELGRNVVVERLFLGRYAEAMATSEQLIGLHPQDPTLLANHAAVLLVNQDVPAAAEAVHAARALLPGDPVTAGLAALIDEVVAGHKPCPTRFPFES